MGFRRAWRARPLQYTQRDFGLVGRLGRRKPGVGATRKRVTRPSDAPLGLPAAPAGHRGSGPRRRESANPKPYMVKWACDQTIWDAHARMGPRTRDSGRSCGKGPVAPATCGWGTRDAGDARTPPVEPHARRRGKSRDSRMLDWDAPARLTPFPSHRPVSRAPAPSPPRSRHCATAGSPCRRAATV